MNISAIKNIIVLILMVAFLIMAIITNDTINSQLFTSLAIILGALTLKNFSTKNQIKNE
jgi:hypothetical protein